RPPPSSPLFPYTTLFRSSRAARPDLCPPYLGRPAADRVGPAVLRRRPDAARRPHRARAAVDPEPACLRRPGAIGRGGAWRGVDEIGRASCRERVWGGGVV